MHDEPLDLWGPDKLGYRYIGKRFTNLIQSIHDSKVLSIEAGFGRGKTFFRKAWAQDLIAAGEVVIELDAQVSDHLDDPVVTFLGALIAAVPEKDTARREEVIKSGKKIVGAVGKAVLKAALREGADEIEAAIEGEDATSEALKSVVGELGQEVSKFAGELLHTQLVAEKFRTEELPAQLDALHAALTEHVDTGRVVIIIDELDRCHPDYAIALLEAMKLVFSHPGFVFVLMVNDEYLENLATHRFGGLGEGERYLDKFIDLRLQLPLTDEVLTGATEQLFSKLPLEMPYGDDYEFSVERAAKLAGELAPKSGLTIRQIKRVLDKVELALRCYRDHPIDAALLVLLGFEAVSKKSIGTALPRKKLDPVFAKSKTEELKGRNKVLSNTSQQRLLRSLENEFACLVNLPKERYGCGQSHGQSPIDRVYHLLAPHYIPSHQAMLDGVHALQVETND